ncbi:chitin synthase, partial [Tremellales sp. Uapishka_1]
MNPGDLYHDPRREQNQNQNPNQNQNQNPYASPTRQTFPPSQTYPSVASYPAVNPLFQTSSPQRPAQLPPSSSYPQAGYADPFNAPPEQNNGGGWDAHNHPAYPATSPPPIPRPPTNPPPRSSAGFAQPYPEPPRTRFDSNASYHSAGNLSAANSYPYGLDDRLSSPPPLLPHHSSTSSIDGYPPNRPPTTFGYNGAEEDFNDSAPLLSHATPDARFGIPSSHSAMSMRPPPNRFQLTDNGRQPMPMGDYGGGDVGISGGYSDADLEKEEVNVHYEPVPKRVLRRGRTQKKVQLFNGHVVLDINVPSMLLDQCPERTQAEFTKMRYTAVTCDPNDFVADRYTLRQRLYDPPRQTELFIVVVCIVADGRSKINPRTRSVLAALGVYQDGVGQGGLANSRVTAHLYEYTTQLSITSNGKIGPGGSHTVPIQMIFCLKEKNQKKINSHRWFFNAFGACLRPNVCVLLDVGTQPGPDSIYHLWKAFDINSSVGGACGEIVALKGLFWRNLLNPLVAAQNFEYKMSNILDKPLESIFGYITVLPGAFSAYRYIALLNDEKGQGPLEKYFLGETMHGADAGIFSANMYLAEDRILCWELVAKRGCKWTLHYVKSAYAITDVPDTVAELVSQRRRWLNGSFFAAIHSVVHFGYVYRSSHSFVRKFFLHIELFYQTISLIFSWFSLGNYYIAFIVLTSSMQTVADYWKYVNIPLKYFYLAFLLLCFLLALGNRPAGSKVGYTMSMVGFAIITVYMIFAAIYLAIQGIDSVEAEGGITASNVFGNRIFTNIILSLAATYGLYIISSLFALDPWHMVTSFIQYLLLAPSYINVLNVYAFCNVHDVSWGTKGSDKASEDLGVVKPAEGKNEVTVDIPVEQHDINEKYTQELTVLATKPPKEEAKVSADQKQEDYYKNFRTNVLLAWTMSNGALAAAILSTSQANSGLQSTYMGILLYTVAGLAFFRFIGSTGYLIVRLFAGE